MVSGVRRMNEVNARRARLVLGSVFGRGTPSRYVTSQLDQLSPASLRAPGSPNRVPASPGVKAGMSPLSGGR